MMEILDMWQIPYGTADVENASLGQRVEMEVLHVDKSADPQWMVSLLPGQRLGLLTPVTKDMAMARVGSLVYYGQVPAAVAVGARLSLALGRVEDAGNRSSSAKKPTLSLRTSLKTVETIPMSQVYVLDEKPSVLQSMMQRQAAERSAPAHAPNQYLGEAADLRPVKTAAASSSGPEGLIAIYRHHPKLVELFVEQTTQWLVGTASDASAVMDVLPQLLREIEEHTTVLRGAMEAALADPLSSEEQVEHHVTVLSELESASHTIMGWMGDGLSREEPRSAALRALLRVFSDAMEQSTATATDQTQRTLYRPPVPGWEEQERELLHVLEERDRWRADHNPLEPEPAGADALFMAQPSTAGSVGAPPAIAHSDAQAKPKPALVTTKVEVRKGYDLVRVGNFSEQEQGVQVGVRNRTSE